jgi:hypothetical protein
LVVEHPANIAVKKITATRLKIFFIISPLVKPKIIAKPIKGCKL